MYIYRVGLGWSRPEWLWCVGVGEELREQLNFVKCGNDAGYFELTTILVNTVLDMTPNFSFFCLFSGGSQFQSSAPVNIPGSFSSSAPFGSPSPSPPIRPHTSPFFSSHLSQPSQSENTFLGPSHSSLGWLHYIYNCESLCVLFYYNIFIIIIF